MKYVIDTFLKGVEEVSHRSGMGGTVALPYVHMSNNHGGDEDTMRVLFRVVLIFSVFLLGISVRVMAEEGGSSGNVYYVAPLANGGSDMNPGTYDKPFATIQRAVGLAGPGTTINVKGGVYREVVVIPRSGTPENPIVIQNYSDEAVTIDGSMPVTGWQWVTGTIYKAQFTHVPQTSQDGYRADAAPMATSPDGWTLSGDRRAQLLVDNTADERHWLEPVDILGNPAKGVKAAYTPETIPPGTFATDVTPPGGGYNGPYHDTANWIYINLGGYADFNPANHLIEIAAYNNGMVLEGRASWITIKGFTFAKALAGITGNGKHSHITITNNVFTLHKLRDIDWWFASDHWTISYNDFHHSEYEFIHTEGSYTVIEHNTIHDTIARYSRWGSMGINICGPNATVTDNIIYNIKASEERTYAGGHGIFFENWANRAGYPQTSQHAYVARNIIHDVDNMAFYLAGADYNTIANNLVYRAKRAFNLEVGYDGPSEMWLLQENVIVHNTVYDTSAQPVFMDKASIGTTLKNNIFAWSGSKPAIVDQGQNTTMVNNFIGDPLFLDAADDDYHLSVDSPAINSGVLDTGITDDLERYPRDAAPDVGAYEHH